MPVEGALQCTAKALHGSNGRHGDQRCDQAIFDGCRACDIEKYIHINAVKQQVFEKLHGNPRIRD